MSRIKNDGLGQYDAEPFKQQQFRTLLLLGLSIKTYTDVILTHQTKLVDIITYWPNL